MKWVQFIACEGLGLSDTACTIWVDSVRMCWIVASWVTPAVSLWHLLMCVMVCSEGTHGPAPLPAREMLWKCPWCFHELAGDTLTAAVDTSSAMGDTRQPGGGRGGGGSRAVNSSPKDQTCVVL